MRDSTRIEIRVTTEDSRSITVPTLVEIGTFGGGIAQQGFTDADGRAAFTLRSGASYRIKVSGGDIEAASSSFELMQGENFHTETIVVKRKPSSNASNVPPGGLVSATMLNVPEKARREFDKGMQQMKANKWVDAKKHFERAIHEYPNFDWAFNNLGVTNLQLKDTPAAREAFARAITINEKNPDASRNLARLDLQVDNFDSAKGLLQKSLTSQPDNPETLALLAYAQFKTREFEAALSNAEKVHRGEPDQNPLAHLIAAAIRENKGDSAGAMRQYQTYLKEAPDTPQAQVAKQGLARLQAQASK